MTRTCKKCFKPLEKQLNGKWECYCSQREYKDIKKEGWLNNENK